MQRILLPTVHHEIDRRRLLIHSNIKSQSIGFQEYQLLNIDVGRDRGGILAIAVRVPCNHKMQTK